MERLSSAKAYDEGLDDGKRRTLGAFYTPQPIIDAILERTLEPRLRKCVSPAQALGVTVYDPSCGDGRFLVSARARIHRRIVELDPAQARRPKLLETIGSRCLFGADVDEEALGLARSVLAGATLWPEDSLCAPPRGPFDIVIGNPPYGIGGGGGGESTKRFISHALDALKEGGAHGFIVPKALLYSSVWHSSLKRLLAGLSEVIDCGKAWREVKLEQVIYVYLDPRKRELPSYLSSSLKGGEVCPHGTLDKTTFDEFGFLLNGISERELAIARRMSESAAPMASYCTNTRGAPIQRQLQASRGRPVYGGREVGRFALGAAPRGFLPSRSPIDRRAVVESGGGRVILAQNIVAHVSKPFPRLKIAAALAPAGPEILVLDTINKISWNGPYSTEAALAVVNSKAVSWYIYRFIVGRAVRTIHLDAPVTDRILVPRSIDRETDARLSALAREMALQPSLAADEEIECLVARCFGLGEREARAVRV